MKICDEIRDGLQRPHIRPSRASGNQEPIDTGEDLHDLGADGGRAIDQDSIETHGALGPVVPEGKTAVRPHGDSEPIGEALAPGRGRALGIGIQEQHPRTLRRRVRVRVKVRCGSAGQTNRAADGEAGLARSALAMPEGNAGRGHGVCAHESPARSMLSGSRTRIMIGSRSLQSTRRNRSTRWGFHKRTPCGVRWRSKAVRISARHAASRFRSLWVTSMKRAAKLSQSG